MPVRLSVWAEADLRTIYLTSIERFGRDQAERYLSGIERAVGFLADHPFAARERREISPPVRVHRHRSHLIVYVVDDEGVFVLRIRHGREAWQSRE